MRRPVLAAAAAAAAALAAALVALVALAAPSASAETVTLESFENGFGPWASDTDGKAPVSTVMISREQAFHGVQSARIFMDGRKDDGTTWLERQFTGPPNARLRISLSFRLWSAGEGIAGGWLVVGHAGVNDPEAEGDFTRLGYTETVRGWRPYGRTWTVDTDSTGRYWVALGTSVVWEVQKWHFVDYVRVDVVRA